MNIKQIEETSQLPFGWVCFSNLKRGPRSRATTSPSQLPFGWVCFSNARHSAAKGELQARSQLPFGWVCFSNLYPGSWLSGDIEVSIAFRLGLFL